MHSFVQPPFGKLEWDPILDGWLGGVEFDGETVEVLILAQEEQMSAALVGAAQSLAWVQANASQVQRNVLRAAVGIYNDSWRLGADPLNTDEMATALELVRICFETDGAIMLSYGAGDLFGGHIVDAVYCSDRTLQSVNLVG